MNVKRLIRGRRKWLLIAACVLMPPLLVIGYAWYYTARNAAVEDAYWAYVKRHRAVTPAVSHPGDDLVRFYDESKTFRSSVGLTSSMAGFQRPDGTIAIPAIYTNTDSKFSEGLAWAGTLDGRLVFLRPDGSEAFEVNIAQEDGVWNFSSGRARFQVRTPSGWHRVGFIDTQGNPVIPAIYDHASSFEGEFALVKGTTWLTVPMENFVSNSGIGIPGSIGQDVHIIDRDGNRVPASQLP